MAERAGKGQDALVNNALNGLNAMPPRGGRTDLSDEQIQAVVEFMLQ
jgi:cytochrome c5